MIKCRQGGAAARPKFIIALGCMSAECESEGGLQEGEGGGRRAGGREEGEKKVRWMQREACVIWGARSPPNTVEFSGAWRLHLRDPAELARGSPIKLLIKRRGEIRR